MASRYRRGSMATRTLIVLLPLPSLLGTYYAKDLLGGCGLGDDLIRPHHPRLPENLGVFELVVFRHPRTSSLVLLSTR
jgi:hypothetical protein